MLNHDQERIATEPLTIPTSSSRPVSAEHSSDKGTVIGKSVVIKGEVTGTESLFIEGKVEGVINLPGNGVTVGRNGQVNATVTAREIVVQGKVVGNVDAIDRLNVGKEGSLTGDAIAHRIMVEDGAFFKGKIDIRNSSEAGQRKAATMESREPASLPH